MDLVLDGVPVDANVLAAITDATLIRSIEEPSRIELTVHDPKRLLVRSPIFTKRTTTTLDGFLFELVQVRKSGSFLSVVFEDATVADLRRLKGRVSAKAGTTTVDAFARRLVSGAPGAKFVGYPGQRNLAPLLRGSQDAPDEDTHTALQRMRDERQWRYFVDRRTVYLGPDSWLLSRATPVEVREHAQGVEDVDFDFDAGKKAPDATLTVDLGRWAVPPGQPVTVLDLGLGSGLWLVKDITRPALRTTGQVTLTRQQPALPEPKPDTTDAPTAAGIAAAPPAVGTATKGPISATGFAWPLTGPLTSGFGHRASPGGIGSTNHMGQDIGCPIGTPVHASKAGTVAFAGTAGGYGTAVYLDHGGGQATRYGHLSVLEVRPGQTVKQGEEIARSGQTGTATGPHLHFEIRLGGVAKNPLDYLPRR